MVFYQPTKRERLARKPGDRVSILYLVDETILDILKYDFTTPDVLSLRIAHPNFEPACTTWLSKHIQRLYIHPSTTFSRAAVDICKHPEFRLRIMEVVLLGKVLWREIESVYPAYRASAEKNYYRAKGWNWKFRAWPIKFPTAKDRIVATLETGSKEATSPGADSFGSVYIQLLQGLKGLPKLEKLSFAEQADVPGFNMTSEQSMISHARKCILQLPPGTCLPTRRGSTKDVMRFSDAEAFFNLLFRPELPVSEIALTAELPFVNDIIHGLTVAPEQTMTAKLNALTSVELHLDYGWQKRTKWQQLCRAVLEHTKNLETLRLAWRPNAAIKKAWDEASFRYLIEELTFPRLRTLKLRSLQQASVEGEPTSPRQARPMCLLTDIANFIEKHAETLQHVRFDSVTFVSPSNSCAVRTMHELSEALGECEQLETLSWVIPEFGHDSQCKCDDRETMVECKFECGIYSQLDRSNATQERFRELVVELGVGLQEKSGCWDFGKYVWRQRALKGDGKEEAIKSTADFVDETVKPTG